MMLVLLASVLICASTKGGLGATIKSLYTFINSDGGIAWFYF